MSIAVKVFFFIADNKAIKLECLSLACFIQANPMSASEASGLYYKQVTIVNYTSNGVNKLKASLNDDATVIIYDHQMFIVQATEPTYVRFVTGEGSSLAGKH